MPLLKIRTVIILAFLLSQGPRVWAQEAGAETSTSVGQATNLARYEGLIIDSIVIDNRNIYDLGDPRFNNFLFKTANKLHYATRKGVVRSELLFRAGKPFSSDLAEETVRNLRNRLRVYEARIEIQPLANGHLLVRVVTVDQWSLSGGFEISREGKETRYRLWTEEHNFMGRNVFISMQYLIQQDERSYLTAQFLNRRVLGRPYSVTLGYSDNPLGKFRSYGFARPFYNLLQRFSFGVEVSTTGGRTDQYRDGLRIAESEHDGDVALVSAEYRFGSYLRKLSLLGHHVYRYENAYNERILSGKPADSLQAVRGFPLDSVYHVDGVGVKLASVRYVTKRHVDSYGYLEDFSLGQVVQMGLSRAFTPDYHGHFYDVLEFQVNQGYHAGGNLFFLGYSRAFWFKGSNDLRRTVSASARFYNNSLNFLTLAARLDYLSDWTRNAGNQLNLGGLGAIRGYDKFFRSGNKMGVANVEGRFFPGVEILSVGLGGAVFADFGQIWKDGESFNLKGVYAAVGAGLRLYMERVSKGKVLRFDMTYSDINGWQLSVGTGQYFQARESSLLLTNW